MSNFTTVQPGQINGAGADDALFLKLYAGETLAQFTKVCKAKDLVLARTITHGKSASFPVMGRVVASFHTPGTEITGQSVNFNEVLIHIDDKLIAPVFIADINEAKNHFDVRQPLTQDCGTALAEQYDERVFRVIALAARSTGTVTGRPGGVRIESANMKTDAALLANSIFEASQKLDENNVPEEDRYCVLAPAQYNLLVKSKDVINKDWGGEGSYAKGQVAMIDNVKIIKSNSVPSTNIASATPGEKNTYHGNFTTTAGLVFHKTVAGTLKLMDLAVGIEWSERHQGTLIVAKMAVGHGKLRPEAVVELATGPVV